MTEERERQRRVFLARQGLSKALLEPLQPDASFRRYFRISQAGRRWMLMDSPPEHESTRAYVAMAQHLSELGLRSPSVFVVDLLHGFALLEDLGDDTYTRLLARGEDAAALYRLAIDVLRYLHSHPRALALELPAYDEQWLLNEAVLLVDWYWPELRGRRAPQTARARYLDAWQDILRMLPATPPSLVLRDFHVDNLMRVPGPAGLLQCALLDFQGAVIGLPAYDVVSLLEDARRDLPPGLVEAMLERYLDGCSLHQREVFMHCYTVLGAQRHCKVLGLFVRLCRRDGKCHYLAHVPRVLRLLESHLHRPWLAPLRDWLERYLPEWASYQEICRSPCS